MDSMSSPLFHNCCISIGKVHFLERPWIRQSFLSPKSSKNASKYKHSWSCGFLVGSTDFKNLHISYGNTQILERPWVR